MIRVGLREDICTQTLIISIYQYIFSNEHRKSVFFYRNITHCTEKVKEYILIGAWLLPGAPSEDDILTRVLDLSPPQSSSLFPLAERGGAAPRAEWGAAGGYAPS